MNTQECEPSLLRNEPRAQADGPHCELWASGVISCKQKIGSKASDTGESYKVTKLRSVIRGHHHKVGERGTWSWLEAVSTR